MAGFTSFAQNHIIDFIFRGQALGFTNSTAAAGTGPTNLYVALFTTAPTDASSTGTEVSAAGYARVGVASSLANWAGTQAAASTTASSANTASGGGTTSNNGTITFGAPTANWGTIVAFGVYDATSAGNLIFWANLTTSKTVNNGDAAPSFAISALTFTLD